MSADTSALPLTIHRASGFLQRLGGLLARAPLQAHEALYLAPCNSVHTLGMRYAIDVVFVDRDGGVLKVVAALPPWRAAGCLRAAAAVEMRAGQARLRGITCGTVLVGATTRTPEVQT